MTFQCFVFVQPAEIDKCGVNIDEPHRSIHARAGFGALSQHLGYSLGHHEHDRRAPGSFPQGKFSPVLFLAQMPTVISPEYDDGIGRVRAFLQCVEHAPNLFIGEGNGSQVAVHSLFPLVMFAHLGVVPLRLGHLYAGSRHVLKVILDSGWQFDFVFIKEIEIFLGHIPRQMWPVDAAGQKEGFVVFTFQLANNPVGHLIVTHCLGRLGYRSPVKMRRFGKAINRALGRKRVIGFILFLVRKIGLPGGGIRKTPMIDFS